MIPALPAALAGITWFLFYNGHNSGVPALMRSHYVYGSCNLKPHPRGELRYGEVDGGKRSRLRCIGGQLHALSPCIDVDGLVA
jgi:hypothetical protein